MKQTIALILTVALSLTLSSVATADHHKPVNTKCPVSGEPIDADQVVSYSKVVGLCCGKCLGKFKKDPSAHAAKIAKVPAGKISNTSCPMSGEPVDDSKTFTYNGAKIGFCCDKCLGKFKDDPAAHAKKIKYDKPANEKCIFSDEPVDAEKVAFYSVKVGLCCGKCASKFEKDPDAYFGKVEFAK